MQIGFTHVDPFEDTESLPASRQYAGSKNVSPTSIRSRILKDYLGDGQDDSLEVSPTSIRSRILKDVQLRG